MKLKRFRLQHLGVAGAFMIVLAGCYPKGPEFISEYNIVVTDYEEGYDFGSQNTYYMPDTMNFETNISDIKEEDIRKWENLILGEIASNMADRGYSRVDTTAAEPPDLVLTVSAVAFENTGVGWVPGPGWGWWGGYYPPGWWGPGWGWGYPGWYPVGYSYSTGSVIMHLGDPDDVEEEDGETYVKIKWLGALDGLLSSYESTNEANIRNGIDQAFVQSPYLQSN